MEKPKIELSSAVERCRRCSRAVRDEIRNGSARHSVVMSGRFGSWLVFRGSLGLGIKHRIKKWEGGKRGWIRSYEGVSQKGETKRQGRNEGRTKEERRIETGEIV